MSAGCIAPGAGHVHPTAVVETGASIDPTATVGPLAVIGGQVVIGPGCCVGPHAVIGGQTRLGSGTSVGSHAVLGAPPQIRDLDAPPGALLIGEGNCVRELVTIHAASPGKTTRVGDRNLLMAYSHVAHDCQLGDGIELANGVQLAGHVVVEDGASLGGLAAVHQFVRVGSGAFVGAGAMVSQDVLPYTLVSGDRARTFGLNLVGLRRRGCTAEDRRRLQRALRALLDAPTLAEGLALARAAAGTETDEVRRLLAFAASAPRGICRPVGRARRAE
jgi:UDP-N-acetylglucosamine acyltransferase